MEQFKSYTDSLSAQYRLNSDQIEKLMQYALYLSAENLKYNLTGHKTIEDILENLIGGSLLPLPLLNVPRGTYFADLGTGAGIPGIPLSICLEDSKSVLFDSNAKKIRFIEEFCRMYKINNVRGVSCRIEEAGKDRQLRESFDWVFSRAMADLYIISEMASPLLKTGGYLYLYSRDLELTENIIVRKHLEELGLELCCKTEENSKGIKNETEGILLKKIFPCGEKFPRRYAAIKRDRDRI